MDSTALWVVLGMMSKGHRIPEARIRLSMEIEWLDWPIMHPVYVPRFEPMAAMFAGFRHEMRRAVGGEFDAV